MTTRTVQISQNEPEVQSLKQYQLCFGQKVKDTAGNSKINVIWKSTRLAPHMELKWDIKYALSYTKDIPAVGMTITYSGDWQACGLGGSYTIDEYGFWKSASGGKSDYLNITGNEYDTVYPVVGLWDAASQSYLPFFVDTTPFYKKGQAHYQPQSESLLWYAAGVQTSQMIDDIETSIGTINTSKANPATGQLLWKTSFDTASGKWTGDVEEA